MLHTMTMETSKKIEEVRRETAEREEVWRKERIEFVKTSQKIKEENIRACFQKIFVLCCSLPSI